jgi:hypothetical protein
LYKRVTLTVPISFTRIAPVALVASSPSTTKLEELHYLSWGKTDATR